MVCACGPAKIGLDITSNPLFTLIEDFWYKERAKLVLNMCTLVFTYAIT